MSLTISKTSLTRRAGQVAFCAAASLVAALAFAPQTGWLVRQQLRGGMAGGQMLRMGNTPSSEADQAAARAQTIARAQPDDFPLQLAATLRQPAPQGVPQDTLPGNSPAYLAARRVWAMRDRFPNEPALYATFLRLSCTYGDMGRGLEEELLTSNTLADAQAKVDARLKGKPVPPTFWETHPEQLQDMAEAAQTGERIDPGNAYFPLLLARAEFARHHDAQALQAIERAGASRRFDTYCASEAEGLLKLADAEYGRAAALPRVAVISAILFPDLAQIRSVARIASAKAILAEQSGDAEQGFLIRRSLSRTGALMRYDGGSMIHSLVGMAIVQVSSTRPGGDLPISKTAFGEDGDEARAKERQDRYAAYLTRIGHPEEARWFTEETLQRKAVKAILKHGLDKAIFGGDALAWVGVWWTVCFALLVTTVWMLIGGGIGSLVARGARARDASPLHFAARRAFGAVVAALAAAGLTGWLTENVAAMIGGALGALALPVVFLWRNPTGTGRELTRAQSRIQKAHSLKTYGKIVGLTLAVLMLVGATIPCIVSGILGAWAVCQAFSSSESSSPLLPAARVFWTAGALSLSGLLCTFVGSLVWSLKRRFPVSLGLALGFRSAALPIAAIWLLGYAGAAFYTARLEASADRDIAQTTRHEGHYLAQLSGEAWPGLVPESTNR